MHELFGQLHHKYRPLRVHVNHSSISSAPNRHETGAGFNFLTSGVVSTYGFGSPAGLEAVEHITLGSEISTITSCFRLNSLLPDTTAWHTSSQMPMRVPGRIELFSITVPQSTQQSRSTQLQRVMRASSRIFEFRPM